MKKTMKKKNKKLITTNQIGHPEQETIMGAETKQVSNKIEKLFVTYVVKKTTWHQNVDSKTRSHMTIGILTNSRGLGTNNNNITNRVTTGPKPRR